MPAPTEARTYGKREVHLKASSVADAVLVVHRNAWPKKDRGDLRVYPVFQDHLACPEWKVWRDSKARKVKKAITVHKVHEGPRETEVKWECPVSLALTVFQEFRDLPVQSA